MTDIEGEAPATSNEDVTIVLAAVDTSSLATRVLDLASQMARRTFSAAQLHLVHVFRAGPFNRPSRVGLRTDDLIAEARNYLDYHVRMARRLCPAPVTGHFAEGEPAEEIVKTARSLGADLLLVGTHDHVGLEKLLIGSVASKVAKSAPCSVVIVRHKQRPFIKVPG
jgi:nucleotide-binding universal stress UspA family protein